MVSDLHALLMALNIQPPIVLVGRSLGALPAQLYACEYPTEVAGIVLLDPMPDLMLTGYYAPVSMSPRPASDTPTAFIDEPTVVISSWTESIRGRIGPS